MPTPKRKKGEKLKDWRSRIISFYIDEGKPPKQAEAIAYDETGTARKGMFECSIIKQGEVTQWATIRGKRVPLKSRTGTHRTPTRGPKGKSMTAKERYVAAQEIRRLMSVRDTVRELKHASKEHTEMLMTRGILSSDKLSPEWKATYRQDMARIRELSESAGFKTVADMPTRNPEIPPDKGAKQQWEASQRTRRWIEEDALKAMTSCSFLKSGTVTDLLAFRPDVTCECPTCGGICKTETGVACYRRTCEKCGIRMRQTGKAVTKSEGGHWIVYGGRRIRVDAYRHQKAHEETDVALLGKLTHARHALTDAKKKSEPTEALQEAVGKAERDLAAHRKPRKKVKKMASIAVISGGAIRKQEPQRFATIRGKKVPMGSRPAKAKEVPTSDVPSAITTLGPKAEKAYREGADVARADLADTERKGTREHYRPMEIQRSVNESRQEADKSPEHYAWWVGYRDVVMPYLEDKMRSETGQRW